MTDRQPDLWNIDVWVLYLAAWMTEYFEGTLDTDFLSFGHPIVPKGKITPMSFYTFRFDYNVFQSNS